MRRGAWTREDVKIFSEGDNAAKVRELLRGNARLEVVDHIIDCSVDPFIPNGWSLHPEDQIPGRIVAPDFRLTREKLGLFLADGQKNGKTMLGTDLKVELGGKPVLPAHVLDYLLTCPERIPRSWKFVFFWGTIYRDSHGSLVVRCLCRGDGEWRWFYNWLFSWWGGAHPAAVLASNN